MFNIRPNVLADIYAAIEDIVFMSELNGVRAQVTLLDDRYQNPRGQYRDILMLFKINGYACELQINVQVLVFIETHVLLLVLVWSVGYCLREQYWH